MLQGIVIWLLTLILAYLFVSALKKFFKEVNSGFLMLLFFYHSLLAITYYLYALSNPSDSINYYNNVTNAYRNLDWLSYLRAGSDFVEFLTFPLANYLSLTYESCMMIFSFFGYIGFIFFYIFFRERLFYKPKIFGYDGITIIFLLPNLHFWSSSIGKGSVIFLAFGLFFFALKAPLHRIIALVIGGWIMYMVRSHIFFVVLVALAVGFTFSTKGVSPLIRVGVLVCAVVITYYIYDDILRITGLEDESILDPFISHRASELTKATSGIDITNYSMPEKLFAFCFRPLFFDAPGILGFIVSFENLLYLFLFISILTPTHLKNLIASDAIVKTCFLTFLGVSLALAQITGNLGLAMRQKSQVMILMMFVVMKLYDTKQHEILDAIKKRKARLARMKQKLQPLQV